MDSPYYARYTNLPHPNYQSYVRKETLSGELYGYEISYDYPIDDVTDRSFGLHPFMHFNIENGTHCDFDNNLAPINIENGGCIMIESGDSPIKSVKIYKITR